jgi:N-acetylglucosaminyl-diphospho-decaprenol L-rhamnosyltransferase
LTLDITIIIPNYNTQTLLRNCLKSIYEHTKGITFEVICIDDNSSDGSADMVAHEFPNVILVRNEVGQMYAKNNNLGMKMSRARYACLLNSDTKLVGNAFQAIVQFMDSHADAAACTPKLINPDGSTQSCLRRFGGFGTMVLQGINWHKLFPNGRTAKNYYAADFDHSREQIVDALGSTAFVIRRSTWEKAGMLDERFPLFQVDLAYCYMLKKKNYRIYYTPCAEIIHYGGQSVNQMPKASLRQMHDALHDFNEHYDYFGSNPVVKKFIHCAISMRYWLKIAEYHISTDKRVNKGPGRAKHVS